MVSWTGPPVIMPFPSHTLLRFRFHKVCLLVTCITLSQTLLLLSLVPFATVRASYKKNCLWCLQEGKTHQHAQLQRREKIFKICRIQTIFYSNNEQHRRRSACAMRRLISVFVVHKQQKASEYEHEQLVLFNTWFILYCKRKIYRLCFSKDFSGKTMWLLNQSRQCWH